jgi:hypothetical protein
MPDEEGKNPRPARFMEIATGSRFPQSAELFPVQTGNFSQLIAASFGKGEFARFQNRNKVCDTKDE